jgi:hypothetical protein
MVAPMTTEALVRKTDLGEIRLREVAETALTDGQVRVRIESFALTANNVTYAAFGDAMDYWRFFPSGREGWGIVPVWGFASVTQSNHPGVAVGERLYGFWPMASGTVLQPVKLSPGGFADGQAHREGLHAVYNQYQRCALDPLWTAKTEDIQALLRPLFTTAWLIDDFLADNAFFGADTVLLSSASSKTASATAFHLKQRGSVEVIGLTAGSRREFCERLGCYSQVRAYEELELLPPDRPLVYVDFAGRGELRRAIHTHFTQLKHDAAIGSTHHEHRAPPGDSRTLPGPAATFFFAPAQVRKRVADWGSAGFGERMAQAWSEFVDKATDPAAPWFRIQHHDGGAAVQAAWTQVHGGIGHPRAGHILSLAAAPGETAP